MLNSQRLEMYKPKSGEYFCRLREGQGFVTSTIGRGRVISHREEKMAEIKEETDEKEMEKELKGVLKYVEPFVTALDVWPLGPESVSFLKMLQRL